MPEDTGGGCVYVGNCPLEARNQNGDTNVCWTVQRNKQVERQIALRQTAALGAGPEPVRVVDVGSCETSPSPSAKVDETVCMLPTQQLRRHRVFFFSSAMHYLKRGMRYCKSQLPRTERKTEPAELVISCCQRMSAGGGLQDLRFAGAPVAVMVDRGKSRRVDTADSYLAIAGKGQLECEQTVEEKRQVRSTTEGKRNWRVGLALL